MDVENLKCRKLDFSALDEGLELRFFRNERACMLMLKREIVKSKYRVMLFLSRYLSPENNQNAKFERLPDLLTVLSNNM